MRVKLRSWWQNIKKYKFLIIGIIVAILLFTLAVWRFGWDWTGFNGGYSQVTTTSTSRRGLTTTIQVPSGKTLWDLFNLLGVLAIPAVVGLGAAWFTAQQGKVSDRENTDNQRETALQSYIDKMAELLLEKDLRESEPDDEVRNIARVRTLTVLPQLNSSRKKSVIQFLLELGLINKTNCIVDLNGADLSDVNLRRVNLSGANLSGVNLSGANLVYAVLNEANLKEINLSGADLAFAVLRGASLTAFDQRKTEPNRTINPVLWGANLRGANLIGADLSGADLSGADLSGVDLSNTIVTTEQLNTAFFFPKI